jgi:DNA-binding transcriptional LysR family regulator
MNIQQLRYLIGVSDEGSMSAAARSLHVSQPVISRSIRSFEHEHGVTLFRLSGRRLVPTDAGRAVVDSARRAMAAIDAVSRTAQERPSRDELAIATTPTTGALLVRALSQLPRHLPDLAVRFCSVTEAADMVQMVDEGDADLGFGVLSDQDDVRSRMVGIGCVEVVLVSPEGTDLPETVSWDDIASVPLALPPPTSHRRADIDRHVHATVGRAVNASLLSEDRTCWLAAAQAGLGSFLSYRPVVEGADGIEIRSLRPAETIRLGFVHRPDPVSSVASQLIDAVRSSNLFSTTSEGPDRRRSE